MIPILVDRVTHHRATQAANIVDPITAMALKPGLASALASCANDADHITAKIFSVVPCASHTTSCQLLAWRPRGWIGCLSAGFMRPMLAHSRDRQGVPVLGHDSH